MLERRNRRTLSFAKGLRKRQTPAEGQLWRRLHGKYFLDYKFRRQHPIGKWIVDFVCLKRKVIVELDGDSHELRKAQDKIREEGLKKDGFLIVRFSNGQVKENIGWVLDNIQMALEADRGI